jgi:uncharacterized protein (DUF1697 family)
VKTHIALLRGINVGGNKMIAMSDLRQFIADLGFHNPQTLLQSGNLVFQSLDRNNAELADLLEAETAKRFDMRVNFFLRSPEEWDELISLNPFPREAESDPSHLIVMVTNEAPSEAQIEALQSANEGPEQLRVAGNQIYAYYPIGIGASQIGATPGWNKVASRCTARNWNTVLKIATLARALSLAAEAARQ